MWTVRQLQDLFDRTQTALHTADEARAEVSVQTDLRQNAQEAELTALSRRDTLATDFLERMHDVAAQLKTFSRQLNLTVRQLSQEIHQTGDRSRTVSSAVETASASVHAVAAGAEELSTR